MDLSHAGNRSAHQSLSLECRHPTTLKQVPGRKTDVKDSAWIAQLLQYGLLRGSFVPATPQRELRELTRRRRQLVHCQTAVANRIQKVLEDANIKLGSVASDVLGVSGLRPRIRGCGDWATARTRHPPLREIPAPKEEAIPSLV